MIWGTFCHDSWNCLGELRKLINGQHYVGLQKNAHSFVIFRLSDLILPLGFRFLVCGLFMFLFSGFIMNIPIMKMVFLCYMFLVYEFFYYSGTWLRRKIFCCNDNKAWFEVHIWEDNCIDLSLIYCLVLGVCLLRGKSWGVLTYVLHVLKRPRYPHIYVHDTWGT